MSAIPTIEPSYYRFTRKARPYRAPKHATVLIELIINQGQDHFWPDEENPLMISRGPDTIKRFSLRLEHFNRPPINGIFDFWTKNWVDDTRDPEWPWIHWAFQNVEWEDHGDLFLGLCEIKRDVKRKKVPRLTLRKESGWMYVKKVPGK